MGGDAAFLAFHVPTVALDSQPSNKLIPNDVTSSLEKNRWHKIICCFTIEQFCLITEHLVFQLPVMFFVIPKGFHNQKEVEGKTQQGNVIKLFSFCSIGLIANSLIVYMNGAMTDIL